MRKAGEPNMKVDWEAWAKENIFKTSKIVVKAAQVYNACFGYFEH